MKKHHRKRFLNVSFSQMSELETCDTNVYMHYVHGVITLHFVTKGQTNDLSTIPIYS